MDVEERIKEVTNISYLSSDMGNALALAVRSLVQDVLSETARPDRGSKLLVQLHKKWKIDDDKLIKQLKESCASKDVELVHLRTKLELLEATTTQHQLPGWLSWLYRKKQPERLPLELINDLKGFLDELIGACNNAKRGQHGDPSNPLAPFDVMYWSSRSESMLAELLKEVER